VTTRLRASHLPLTGDRIMGKYFVGWLLGIPAVVLVVLYIFFR
jgi:hypothetical protein